MQRCRCKRSESVPCEAEKLQPHARPRRPALQLGAVPRADQPLSSLSRLLQVTSAKIPHTASKTGLVSPPPRPSTAPALCSTEESVPRGLCCREQEGKTRDLEDKGRRIYSKNSCQTAERISTSIHTKIPRSAVKNGPTSPCLNLRLLIHSRILGAGSPVWRNTESSQLIPSSFLKMEMLSKQGKNSKLNFENKY